MTNAALRVKPETVNPLCKGMLMAAAVAMTACAATAETVKLTGTKPTQAANFTGGFLVK